MEQSEWNFPKPETRTEATEKQYLKHAMNAYNACYRALGRPPHTAGESHMAILVLKLG